MSRQLTVRGHVALEAFVNYLAPVDGSWGSVEDLRGSSRYDYANHQAIVSFLDELRGYGARRVYLEHGESVPVSRARFRCPGEAPAIPSQAGVFGFGTTTISLFGTRARMSASGVLSISDAWGDTICFGTSSDAAFAETEIELDEWDLPAPVPPLVIPDEAIQQFKPQAAAIAATLLATHPTDRARAEAAIGAHWRACRYMGTVPEIRWFASPSQAISALRGSGGLRKTMRDRALRDFDVEVAVRLQAGNSVAEDDIWKIADAPLNCRVSYAVRDTIYASKVNAAREYLGIISDYRKLNWYVFLKSCGVNLPDVVASFCTMTAETWLIFPTYEVILAVERPRAVELNDEDCTLVFANKDHVRFRAR